MNKYESTDRHQLAFQDGGDAHAARGADGDEPAAAAALGEDLGERRDDARAGRGERVADRDRAAAHVEPRAVDRAERLREPEPLAAELRRLPGLQRAQHLRSERLVDLVEVEVLEPYPC